MNSQILKKVAESVGTPFFVYDGQVLEKNINTDIVNTTFSEPLKNILKAIII